MPIPFLPKRISSFQVSFVELKTKDSEEVACVAGGIVWVRD